MYSGEPTAIFVINLEADAERLAFMCQQLESFSLPWQRVPAVDAHQISDDVVAYENGRVLHRYLSPVEIACLHSHVSVWKTIVNDGLEYALILEDDAVLSKDLPAFLADPSLLVSDDCAIRLETFNMRVVHGRAMCEVQGRSIYPLRSIQYGAAAYIITRKRAQALLDAYAVHIDTADRLIFCDSLCNHVYQVVPALAIQRDIQQYGSRQAGDHTRLQAGRCAMERQSWYRWLTCQRRLLWKWRSVLGISCDILKGYAYRKVPFV
jgi:glycosyl transferase, family 25